MTGPRPLHRATCAASLVAALAPLAACTATPSAPSASPAPSAEDPSSPALPRGDDPVDLDPGDFTAGSDHRYFPLEPGRQWIYRESAPGEPALRVVVTVTSQTRRIANGIEARVVRDTVTERGEVIEDTFDWFAQDADGNVWYLGEDTAELEDGRITTREGSFEAGVDGALPGIIMPAEPEVATRYRQEYAQGTAEDDGEVLALDQQAQVPAGHFTDVLLTADSIALEPRVLEYKLYAPGEGLVLTLDVSGGAGREELLGTRTVADAVARAAGTVALGQPYA